MNGVEIGPKGQVWGPVTKRLADAYQRFVDHDFVGQYLKRYVDGHGGARVLRVGARVLPTLRYRDQRSALAVVIPVLVTGIQ